MLYPVCRLQANGLAAHVLHTGTECSCAINNLVAAVDLANLLIIRVPLKLGIKFVQKPYKSAKPETLSQGALWVSFRTALFTLLNACPRLICLGDLLCILLLGATVRSGAGNTHSQSFNALRIVADSIRRELRLHEPQRTRRSEFQIRDSLPLHLEHWAIARRFVAEFFYSHQQLCKTACFSTAMLVFVLQTMKVDDVR